MWPAVRVGLDQEEGKMEPGAISDFKLRMKPSRPRNKVSYLLTGCAILLRGRLLPFMASEGLGSALRPITPAVAALCGVGIPVLEYNCKPLDKGRLLLP